MKQKLLNLTRLRSLLLLACVMLGVSAWGEKITDYSNIVSGKQYYIGATTGSTDYYLSVDGSSISTSIAGTAVTSKANATSFTFAGSGTSWTIQFGSGYYLSLKDSKDNGKVQVVDKASTFTASNQSSKIRLTIGNYSIQKNNSGTQFGSYGNTQTDVWLEEVSNVSSGPSISFGSHDHVTFEMWDSNLNDIEAGNAVEEGTLVYVRPSVASGYSLESISAVDASGATVTLRENSGAWSFTMPNSNVTISATASEIQNLPKIDISGMTSPLTFSPGSFTSSGSGYKDYNNVTFTGSNNVEYSGWTLTQVMKSSNNMQIKASIGKVVMPQIVSSNGFTVTVTATTNSVIVSDGTNSGTNELTVGSTSANITISTGSNYAVISQITITPANPNAVATPTFDIDEGTYTEAKNVTISCSTEGAAIYYTLNGSTPSAQSTLYASPIVINQSCVLKAIAIKDGESSAIATANYNIYIVQDGVFDFTTGVLNYDSGVTPTNDGQSYIEEAKTWTAGNVTLVTDGKYRWWNSSNSYDLRFYNNSPKSKMTISVPEGKAITRIEITGGTNFVVNCGTYNSGVWSGVSPAVEFTYNASSGSINVRTITVTYADAATITLVSACTDGTNYYGTYSNSSAFVVPEDLTVSEIGVNANGKLNVRNYSTGDIVPANTGVMVSSATAGNHTVILSNETGTSVLGTNNRLRPSGNGGISAAAMATAAPSCKYYRLTMHNGTDLGFYWGAPEGASFDLAANKAYLAIQQPSPTQGFIGINPGEESGIEAVFTTNDDSNVYDLQGRRVAQPQKGLYIVNGKKVIIK